MWKLWMADSQKSSRRLSITTGFFDDILLMAQTAVVLSECNTSLEFAHSGAQRLAA